VKVHHVVRAASLALIVLLVGGCATSIRPASPPASAAGGQSAGGIKRCSPSDPDRYGWFCLIGQLLYNVAGGMQPDGGFTLR